MGTRFRLWALLAFAIALQSCANGSSVSQSVNCTRATATHVEAAELVRTPESYEGKCVRTLGYIAPGAALYPSLEALYSTPDSFPSSGVGGIGLYDSMAEARAAAMPNGLETHIAFRRRYVDLIGLAFTCGELKRQAEEAMRRTGVLFIDHRFCSYGHDQLPALDVVEWHEIGERPLRLIGEESAKRAGNLIEIDDAWTYAEEVKQLAKEALESGAVSLPSSPSFKYFRRNITAPDTGTYRYVAFGCACKNGDCADLWPIAGQDAFAERDWPYVCVRVHRVIVPASADSPGGSEFTDTLALWY